MDGVLSGLFAFINHTGIYVLNGGLLTTYQLWWNLDKIVTLGAALLTVFYFDRKVQFKAAFTPRRYGRSGAAADNTPKTAQAMTAATAALWFVAAVATEPPIPIIGAMMWVTMIIALLIMPQEQSAILWRSKTAILTYALAAIGFRLYLWQVNSLSPQDWAKVVGSTADAQAIIAQNRGLFTNIASWFLWFLAPLGYLSLLMQRFTVNPMSLTAPWKSAADIMRDVRTRGER